MDCVFFFFDISHVQVLLSRSQKRGNPDQDGEEDEGDVGDALP
jgi:hypothetical protein